ncbi:MAG: phosphatidylserine decarboxylase [Proteobacteria bacterium]|nr:phosphatidylserine decarboxylase [Pseudomonadota bacterium]
MTRTRARWLKDPLIRWFARRYRIDWEEARFRSPGAYPDFNSFFTRELRPGSRPVDGAPHGVVSPVDAVVSQAGTAAGDRLFQAKGRTFDLVRLLGGSPTRAAPFRGGSFVTLYLSPRDYHRIHMPVAGTLEEMVCVPGRLFSVNPATTRVVADLFARNERVVTLFETEAGPLALVLVGAVFVGSIGTVWHGTVTPPRDREVRRWEYPAGEVELTKGQEMGRFNMGSTVVMLFGKDRARWLPSLAPGRRVRMGERIGETLPG